MVNHGSAKGGKVIHIISLNTTHCEQLWFSFLCRLLVVWPGISKYSIDFYEEMLWLADIRSRDR